MATVWIPPLMRSLTDNQEQVEVEGETVRQIIEALDARYPGIAARLIDDNRIRPGISVAVDGVIGNKGLREAVKPNSEVHFIPAMSGG
jgi:molybdopterin synthase sulfur carrier subunit